MKKENGLIGAALVYAGRLLAQIVLYPAVIQSGSTGKVISTAISALVGCVLLTGSLESGLYGFGKFTIAYRIMVLGTAFLFLFPHLPTDLAGLAILIILCSSAKVGPFTPHDELQESQKVA